jgi:hypothetical protein
VAVAAVPAVVEAAVAEAAVAAVVAAANTSRSRHRAVAAGRDGPAEVGERGAPAEAPEAERGAPEEAAEEEAACRWHNLPPGTEVEVVEEGEVRVAECMLRTRPPEARLRARTPAQQAQPVLRAGSRERRRLPPGVPRRS